MTLFLSGQKQAQFERMVLDVLLGDTVVVERNGKELSIALTDEKIKAFMNGARKGGLMSPRDNTITVDSIPADSHNANSGLKVGDEIVAINQKKVGYYDEFQKEVKTIKSDSKFFIKKKIKKKIIFIKFFFLS